jgi:hypothetical protein
MRRRRGSLAVWLVIVAILLANALIHWLAPARDEPAVSSTTRPAGVAAARSA